MALKIVKIGLIGDYSPNVVAHIALPKALTLAAHELGAKIETTWLATETIPSNQECLTGFDGLWSVPGSPYRSMEGALQAIRFAREQGRPFLGTCGGFQHTLIEYVRNVLGYADADHAESNPAAMMALITPLSCALVGVTGTIQLKAGSRATECYGKREIKEQYHCNYGVDVRYQFLLELGEMQVTGTGERGEPRVVEIKAHPFFIAMLFQPERSADSGRAHPLIQAYVQAVMESA